MAGRWWRALAMAASLAAAAGPACAHGGAFRPPPGRQPGDRYTPRGGSPGPTTAPAGSAGSIQPWESWWFFNRDPWLNLRRRIEERTVITGERTRDDLFDREGLRVKVLAPLMMEMLTDEDEEVRTSAAVALGKFGWKPAIPALLERFSGDDVKQVREAALIGLLLMRDPGLAARLRDLALDRKQERRARCWSMMALGLLGQADFLTQVSGADAGVRLQGPGSTIDELRGVATLGLGFAGSSGAVPPLLKAALSERYPRPARGYAGSALAHLADPLAAPEMLELVEDSKADDYARAGAAIALGAMVGPEEDSFIDVMGKKAQRDRDGALRSLLTMSLGRIGGERAATHIAAALRDADRDQRGFLLLALGMTRDPQGAQILEREFDQLHSAQERGACALGLALAGYKKAAPMLRDRLLRGHPGYVPHGMVALGILDDAGSIPVVQKILRDERDPATRREGAVALALLRRGSAIPELVALLERCDSMWTRGAVAAALGMVGDDRAVEPLLAIARDRRRQGEERAVALAALGRIGDPEDIPVLSRIAYDLNPYIDSDAMAELVSIL